LKPHAKRLILVDPKEQVISARFLHQDEHIMIGHIVDFKDLSVLVGECIGSSISAFEDNLHASGSKTSNCTRSFVDVVKSVKPSNVSSLPEAPPVRWKATCSHFQNGSSSSQAFLLLRPQAKRLVLLDMQEEVLDAIFLLENEKIHSGLILDLKSHTVVVGERIISNSLDYGVQLLKSSSPKENYQKDFSSVTSHKNLALDFSRGVSFEAACKSKFGHSVTLVNHSRRRGFLLVVSFGRACFKLDIHTVAIVLQSCFGGIASLYKVKLLRDRTFQFTVASSAVGFEIYNLSKICTPMFDLFLNLWGHGGPNWLIEEKNFYKESEAEWQVVQRKKSAAFGTKRVSVFQRMHAPLKPDSFPNLNSILQTVNPYNHVDSFQSFPPNKYSPRAHLPGLLPYFKFPTFNAIIWPDDSYLTWFKAHGPSPLIQEVTSFSALSVPFLEKNPSWLCRFRLLALATLVVF
jgi:hypothetical protein